MAKSLPSLTLILAFSGAMFAVAGPTASAAQSTSVDSLAAQCDGVDAWLTNASDRYLNVTIPSDTNMARWHTPPRTASIMAPVEIRAEAEKIDGATSEQARARVPEIAVVANDLILRTYETTSLALITLADEIELGSPGETSDSLFLDAKVRFAKLQLEIHALRQTCDLRMSYGFVDFWCFPDADQQWNLRATMRFMESYDLLKDALNISGDEVDTTAFASARERTMQLRAEQAADTPSTPFATVQNGHMGWYDELILLYDDALDGTPNEVSNDANPNAPLLARHAAEVELDHYCDQLMYRTYVSPVLP